MGLPDFYRSQLSNVVTKTDISVAMVRFEQNQLGELQSHFKESPNALLHQVGAVIDKEIAA
eukprot:9743363-Karenia_brevis.AAC.1